MPGRLVKSLAAFVVEHRGAVLVACLLVTGLLGLQIPNLTANFTPEDLFARVEGQEAIAREFQAAFGNTDNVVLVLVVADDVLALEPLAYVHAISQQFARDPDVERVSSITVTPIPRPGPVDAPNETGGGGSWLPDLGAAFGGSPPAEQGLGGLGGLVPNVRVDAVVEGDTVDPDEAATLREALNDAPLLEGRLVSADRTVAGIALVLGHDVEGNARVSEVVGRIAGWVDAHPAPEGARALLAGLPYVRLVIVQKMRADQTLLLPTSIVVCLLILGVSFRWATAVVLSTVAVGLSAVMVVGGMAWVDEPVNIINNIVPMLVLIIGISSAIHLVNRYREEYHREPSRQQASLRSLRAMTVALFMTSFTTAVGFASLAVSATPMLRRFGITAALGILLAYVVSITFLPAGLTFVSAPRRWSTPEAQGPLDRLIELGTRTVIRLRWPVLGGSLLAFALAVWLATGLNVNSAVLDQLDPSDEIYQTTRLLEDRLEGMRGLEVSLTSEVPGRFNRPDVLNAMSALQRWAEDQPGVLGTTSYAELLHEAWYRLTGDRGARGATFASAELIGLLGGLMGRGGANDPSAAYVTGDRERARVNIQVADMGSTRTLQLIDELQTELATRFGDLPDVEAALTGDAYIGSMGLKLVVRDLASSLLTAFLIIFGSLALILRSWRLGLVSIPPNILPLVVTMAYMVVRGIPLNLATVIIFSVSIGMAVDGTIHVLARFREELQRSDDLDEALVRAAAGTGRAILFTCLSLMLGFGVMLLSSFPPVRRFGELIAVTMGSCLLATLVMVPALLRVTFRNRRSV